MEFLTARLDDDEARATRWFDEWCQGAVPLRPDLTDGPARAVIEVDVKRRIVEMHEATQGRAFNVISFKPLRWRRLPDPPARCLHCDDLAPCLHLRLLAAPHADHLDYDEAWRP